LGRKADSCGCPGRAESPVVEVVVLVVDSVELSGEYSALVCRERPNRVSQDSGKGKMPEPMIDTFIDVIERVLEIPFEPKYIRDIDAATAAKLAKNIKSFYRDFHLPKKEAGEIRPYPIGACIRRNRD
jgi:hypothetical protein